MNSTAAIRAIESRQLAADPPVQLIELQMSDSFRFEAGQYLEICHPDGTRIPLSIASAPEQLPALTLHYRSTPGLPEASKMDALLLLAEPLRIFGPTGKVRLGCDDPSSLLLIAGGTGIGQALSLAWAQHLRRPAVSVRLLACADREADLYYRNLLPEAGGFEAVLIADPRRDPTNQAIGWLREQAARLADERIILAGSPPFVYAATDALTRSGIAIDRLESDVFAYAPR